MKSSRVGKSENKKQRTQPVPAAADNSPSLKRSHNGQVRRGSLVSDHDEDPHPIFSLDALRQLRTTLQGSSALLPGIEDPYRARPLPRLNAEYRRDILALPDVHLNEGVLVAADYPIRKTESTDAVFTSEAVEEAEAIRHEQNKKKKLEKQSAVTAIEQHHPVQPQAARSDEPQAALSPQPVLRSYRLMFDLLKKFAEEDKPVGDDTEVSSLTAASSPQKLVASPASHSSPPVAPRTPSPILNLNSPTSAAPKTPSRKSSPRPAHTQSTTDLPHSISTHKDAEAEAKLDVSRLRRSKMSVVVANLMVNMQRMFKIRSEQKCQPIIFNSDLPGAVPGAAEEFFQSPVITDFVDIDKGDVMSELPRRFGAWATNHAQHHIFYHYKENEYDQGMLCSDPFVDVCAPHARTEFAKDKSKAIYNHYPKPAEPGIYVYVVTKRKPEFADSGIDHAYQIKWYKMTDPSQTAHPNIHVREEEDMFAAGEGYVAMVDDESELVDGKPQLVGSTPQLVFVNDKTGSYFDPIQNMAKEKQLPAAPHRMAIEKFIPKSMRQPVVYDWAQITTPQMTEKLLSPFQAALFEKLEIKGLFALDLSHQVIKERIHDILFPRLNNMKADEEHLEALLLMILEGTSAFTTNELNALIKPLIPELMPEFRTAVTLYAKKFDYMVEYNNIMHHNALVRAGLNNSTLNSKRKVVEYFPKEIKLPIEVPGLMPVKLPVPAAPVAAAAKGASVAEAGLFGVQNSAPAAAGGSNEVGFELKK